MIDQRNLDAIKAAVVASPIFYIVETYFFNDWEFLKFLLAAMLVDWVWGFSLAWKNRTISEEGFQKFGKKLAEYGTLLILGHIMLNARSGGEPIAAFKYFTTTIHGYLLVREAISILDKIALVSPKLVPKWLLEKLKTYRDTGKIDSNSDERN
ncbi:MAG: phage holin family protein [Algoriphagus aquaeductus]|uniref:phage holin family protein n=1 Tax=Algoriphagus aquaeductus TaxID=475299 RepID=UPI00391CAEEB